jgi:hypothetical protein
MPMHPTIGISVARLVTSACAIDETPQKSTSIARMVTWRTPDCSRWPLSPRLRSSGKPAGPGTGQPGQPYPVPTGMPEIPSWKRSFVP